MRKHIDQRTSVARSDAWGIRCPRKILRIGHIGHTTGIFAPSPFKDFFCHHFTWEVSRERVCSIEKYFLCVCFDVFVNGFIVGRISFMPLKVDCQKKWKDNWIRPAEVGHRSTKEVLTMRSGRRKSNLLCALIRRETNFQGPSDRNLLLSYAEESSLMSCHRTKVRFWPCFHLTTRCY